MEISAGRVRRSVITEVMKQAVRLDRIASAPHAFPNEKAAPRKSLSGAAKLNWIACRMSVTPKDVAIILERASLLLREEVLDVI